jgi:hypothetical protein
MLVMVMVGLQNLQVGRLSDFDYFVRSCYCHPINHWNFEQRSSLYYLQTHQVDRRLQYQVDLQLLHLKALLLVWQGVHQNLASQSLALLSSSHLDSPISLNQQLMHF